MANAMIIAIPVPIMVVDVSTGSCCSGIDIVSATGRTETAVSADELPLELCIDREVFSIATRWSFHLQLTGFSSRQLRHACR